MKRFLSFFDNQFIGVTGKSNKDIALVEMLKKFKIYATKIEFEEQNGDRSYTLDHTVISYLMNKNDEYLEHLGSSLNAKDMCDKITEAIKEDKKPKFN